METIIILCEKCAHPIHHTDNRFERGVYVEYYVCKNPECMHIERVEPEDLTEVPQTMYANY